MQIPNPERNHKHTASTVFDPALVGVVTLLVSVSVFCIFLISLKRGTPQLWPYATTTVAPNRFTIESFTDMNKEPTMFYFDGPKWILNFRNDPILVSENFRQESFVTENISERKKKTEFFFQYPMPNPTYMRCSFIDLNAKKYLWLGGTRDYFQSRPYLTLPPVKAIKCTWFGANPKCILSSHTLQAGPPMNVGRVRPELLKLPNQNIFVSGGIAEYRPTLTTDGAIATDALEEYDSKQKKFTSLGRMQIPRYEHATCLLNDGHILIVSGRTNAKLSDSLTDLTSTIEVFSPKTKTSIIVGQLHRAMANPILIPLKDDKVFIVDNQTLTSQINRQPYAELYENNRLPVQKLPHMPSVAELIHLIIHWEDSPTESR